MRVLEKSGNSVTVSLNGSRVQVSSELELTRGDSFRAQIRVRGNTLFLLPLVEGQTMDQAVQFFSRTGLPADALSLRLVQLFRQLGTGVHTENAVKARRLAARFPGKESEAAEIALQFLEKGIEPFPSEIAAFFALMHGNDTPQEDCGRRFSEEEQSEPPEILKRIYDIPDSIGRIPGLLALFNHLNGASGEQRNHWIVLPYKTEPGKTEFHGTSFRGTLAFLVNPAEQRTLRAAVSAKFSHESWLFSLFMDERKIEFCRFPPVPEEKQDTYIRNFAEIMKFSEGFTIYYIQRKAEESLFSADGEFDTINLEA